MILNTGTFSLSGESFIITGTDKANVTLCLYNDSNKIIKQYDHLTYEQAWSKLEQEEKVISTHIMNSYDDGTDDYAYEEYEHYD